MERTIYSFYVMHSGLMERWKEEGEAGRGWGALHWTGAEKNPFAASCWFLTCFPPHFKSPLSPFPTTLRA